MLELSKQFDFSDSCEVNPLDRVVALDFLHGDDPIRPFLLRHMHNSPSTLAQSLYHLVILHSVSHVVFNTQPAIVPWEQKIVSLIRIGFTSAMRLHHLASWMINLFFRFSSLCDFSCVCTRYGSFGRIDCDFRRSKNRTELWWQWQAASFVLIRQPKKTIDHVFGYQTACSLWSGCEQVRRGLIPACQSLDARQI